MGREQKFAGRESTGGGGFFRGGGGGDERTFGWWDRTGLSLHPLMLHTV